jgi:hypothetical protein
MASLQPVRDVGRPIATAARLPFFTRLAYGLIAVSQKVVIQRDIVTPTSRAPLRRAPGHGILSQPDSALLMIGLSVVQMFA